MWARYARLTSSSQYFPRYSLGNLSWLLMMFLHFLQIIPMISDTPGSHRVSKLAERSPSQPAADWGTTTIQVCATEAMFCFGELEWPNVEPMIMSIFVYLHLECIYFMQISEMYLNQINMAQAGNKHQNSLYSTSDYGSMSTLDQSTLDLTTSMSACSEYGSLMTLNQPEKSPFESIKKPQVMVNSYISKYK